MAFFEREKMNPKFRQWIIGLIKADSKLHQSILSAEPREAQRMIADLFRRRGSEYPREKTETVEFRLQEDPLEIFCALREKNEAETTTA